MPMKRVLLIAAAVVIGGGAVFFVLQQEEQARIRDAVLEEIEQALDLDDDPAKALRLCAEALADAPDDAELLLLRARAYHARGRFSDVLEALDAAEPNLGEEQRDAYRFYRARALVRRFLDTGDRGDFNLAEGDLESLARSGEFDDAASVLLGMGLARKDVVAHRDEARERITRGLKGSGVEAQVDVERARQILESLR